jgi:hypothetical protein
MTDQELTELAAKAVGITGEWHEGANVWLTNEQTAWDPLYTDADAFRLAVDLSLWIQISDRCAWAQQDADSILGETAASSMVMFRDADDPYAAVRRAIVIAAAEAGKK